MQKRRQEEEKKRDEGREFREGRDRGATFVGASNDLGKARVGV